MMHYLGLVWLYLYRYKITLYLSDFVDVFNALRQQIYSFMVGCCWKIGSAISCADGKKVPLESGKWQLHEYQRRVGSIGFQATIKGILPKPPDPVATKHGVFKAILGNNGGSPFIEPLFLRGSFWPGQVGFQWNHDKLKMNGTDGCLQFWRQYQAKLWSCMRTHIHFFAEPWLLRGKSGGVDDIYQLPKCEVAGSILCWWYSIPGTSVPQKAATRCRCLKKMNASGNHTRFWT